LEIISVSIDRDTLGELDKIQDKLGFKSRSKLLRATINSLLNEYNILESAKGHTDGVIVVTYKESDKNRISGIIHKFENCVKTVIHQHHVGVCIDILMVCDDAKVVRDLFSALKREKGVKSLNCSVL
jgi:metal-responsive CopG/Arc/MetJ family transcriptional regulator